ncbi:MAG: tight adherence protein C [Acidimicrobiales bacterium]|jgi:tight adherence protein C
MPLYIWFASGALALSVPLLWWSIQGPTQQTSKGARENLVANRSASFRTAVLERPTSERLLDPILGKLARAGLRFLPSTWFDHIDARLAKAGLLGRYRGEQIVGAKILLTIVGGLLLGVRALQAPSLLNIVFLVLAVGIAWFLPDLVLASRGDRRALEIERELPDVLDQMTISVEAGLGFEAAMARIGEKGGTNLSYEFARTLQDIQFGVNRIEALADMADRTQSDVVRHFILALRQAERMGVPLAKTLRIQAAEMRVRRRLMAEENAHKLPVKLIFPLGLCIFPALFIVILGPAFIQISRIF